MSWLLCNRFSTYTHIPVKQISLLTQQGLATGLSQREISPEARIGRIDPRLAHQAIDLLNSHTEALGKWVHRQSVEQFRNNPLIAVTDSALSWI